MALVGEALGEAQSAEGGRDRSSSWGYLPGAQCSVAKPGRGIIGMFWAPLTITSALHNTPTPEQ